jgi:hypothetical protein
VDWPWPAGSGSFSVGAAPSFRVDPPVASGVYVEEDQEAQGPPPPVEGEPRQASQHGPRLITALLTELRLSAPRSNWEAIGLSASGDFIMVGGVRLSFVESPVDGIIAWGFASDVPDVIDGIPTFRSEPVVAVPVVSHHIAASSIDHVVVTTSSLDRTCAAIESGLGLPLKRTREVGGGVRQGFHRSGEVIIEVVERPDLDSTSASLWGLVLVVDDLDDAVGWLGPDLVGPPRDAVQPGRRIATLRSEAGLGLPVALMSPDQRRR